MQKLIKSHSHIFFILLGSVILAFGMYNIHSRTIITEGGIWGLELLIQHWFGISPAITAPIFDGTCYLLGFVFLGKKFIFRSLLATLGYSGFYAIFEQFPPLLPDLDPFPLAAAVIGAIFVGVGAGLVVRETAAAAGDDALALVISKKSGCKMSTAYLITDLSVLLLSLSYIPFGEIFYSLITVILSGRIIDIVQIIGKKESVGAVLSKDM